MIEGRYSTMRRADEVHHGDIITFNGGEWRVDTVFSGIVARGIRDITCDPLHGLGQGRLRLTRRHADLIEVVTNEKENHR